MEKTSFKLRDRSTLSNGLEDLANKVVHTSMIEGDGAGYDIKSFDDFGNIKYMKLKPLEEALIQISI